VCREDSCCNQAWVLKKSVMEMPFWAGTIAAAEFFLFTSAKRWLP
jgi:hypothetical protein